MTTDISVVMIGATGAVGTEVVKALVKMDRVTRITLLGRSRFEGVNSQKISQHIVDVMTPQSYAKHLVDHSVAICTMGVGEPSKTPRAEFTKIDHDAPLAFGAACKSAGVLHFELLSSVGADANSRSFFLRTKGTLNAQLVKLGFARLSLFQPSMILTPTNRYGVSQALTLAIWPKLKPLLAGPLLKLRGIEVAHLGGAIAANIVISGAGVEVLHWDEMIALRED